MNPNNLPSGSSNAGGRLAAPVSSKSSLELSIITLESTVDALNNDLFELYSKLEPVLSTIPDKPSEVPSKIQSGTSMITEKLYQLNTRIEFMHNALNHIHARLEV